MRASHIFIPKDQSMKLIDILNETHKYKSAKLDEASFLKKLGNKLGFGGGDPVKVADLKRGETYRINNSKKWLAKADYLGTADGKHVFEIVDLYKDYEPMTGKAPKNGERVKYSNEEVEKLVVTDKDADA